MSKDADEAKAFWNATAADWQIQVGDDGDVNRRLESDPGPLSDYWKAFKSAGFEVEDFEEQRLTPERYHLAENEAQAAKLSSRPFSVAFLWRK